MQGNTDEIGRKIEAAIEHVKRAEPEIGEAVGRTLRANLADGRVEKFLNSGTSLTVSEYCQRVCNHYEENHEFVHKLEIEDPKAWNGLLLKMEKWAYSYLCKKGVPYQADRHQIASDCANEAGGRLANIRFPYDVTYDSWACRFVHFVCLNYIRRNTEKIEYADFDLSEADEWLRGVDNLDSASEVEKRLDLLDVIDELSSEDRKAFILAYYFDGMSFDEISNLLRRSKNALYKLHFDALENLRKILQEKRDKNEEE